MTTNTTTLPRLSQAEVSFYQEHGWLLSSPVLPGELLDAARMGLEQHWTGHRDHVLEGANQYFTDWMPGTGAPDVTRNNEYLSLQNNLVRQLTHCPIISAIAADAAQTTSIRLFDDQIVSKPAGQASSTVGWHVDGDYWGTCSSEAMLTAWVPLHDCPEELGPLAVLDGSHRWSHLLDRSALSFHSKDMASLERFVTGAGFEFKPIVLGMKRGQFSLHNSRTIHGSYPNRGSVPRLAFAMHMQDAANHYRPAARPDGRPIQLFNDRICRQTPEGHPDYSDAAVFPLLWSAPAMEVAN